MTQPVPGPPPDPGCDACGYLWMRLRGTWQWVPVWSLSCGVHENPSDLS